MQNGAAPWLNTRTVIAAIVALTLWRVVMLGFDETALWVDEAQYWLWGQHLAWGYFSKPPLIAFWLRAVTDLAGSDSIFWIRVSGAFLHAATAGLIALSANRLFDGRVAAAAALIYITAPMVTLASWLFSTDTLLLPLYALAFYAFLRLCEQRSFAFAVVMGLALGLAFLAKYAVIYFPLSLVLAAILIPSARISWRDAAVSLATALLIISPNLWWNIQNGGTTLKHIAEDNAQVGSTGLFPENAVTFFASQAAVFGPVAFLALLIAIGSWALRRQPQHGGMLLLFSIPVILLMTVQALRADANANWAVVAYVAGSVLAAALLVNRPRWLALGLAVNLILCIALPILTTQAQTFKLPSNRLLAARYVGQDTLSRHAYSVAQDAGLTTIVAHRRAVLADLFHTLRDADLAIHSTPPDGAPKNYYAQVFPLPANASGPVLYITTRGLPCDAAQQLSTFNAGDGHWRGAAFELYRVEASCLISSP